MKPLLRFTILIAILAALLAGICSLLAFSASQRHLQTCNALEVEFADTMRFASEEDIKGYLDSHYGSYVGQRLDSVDLCRVERILDDRGAIRKSEAYTTPDGALHIRIFQREPKVKFQTGKGGFYVDDRGYIFPLQDNYDPSVRVVDGAVPIHFQEGYKGPAEEESERLWIEGILALDAYLASSKIWSEAFPRISEEDGNGLVLTPREGKERFILGAPEDLDAKFGRIGNYYEYIKPAREQDWYRTVNVRYDGQIICRHKN